VRSDSCGGKGISLFTAREKSSARSKGDGRQGEEEIVELQTRSGSEGGGRNCQGIHPKRGVVSFHKTEDSDRR